MKNIIFDLDGTIWDARESIVIAWNNVLERHNINKKITKDDLKAVLGLPFDEFSKRLLSDVDKEKALKILNESYEAENIYLTSNGGLLYHNVEEVLKKLAEKYNLFIVSNCQDGYIEAFYHYHGLDKYFQDYENPGRTGLSKGENIKLIMERNQLMDAVYVGDTTGDQEAAAYAGIPFVFARYGFGEVSKYNYAIDTFEQLLDLPI
ncbi:HAD family hydrolase [Paraliobacillus salinarum]|uniref:HAD family hydrolase n=1 Tax=Paraliobacillus salinarum TaxID=1158996 RepID=UPI0015F6289B|nr:HAD family hydrolase [Paraliobacillus salinarum]